MKEISWNDILKLDFSQPLLTFNKEGKTLTLDYKDGKFQVWGDMEIEEGAKLFFDLLGRLINEKIKYIMQNKEAK